MLSSHLPCLPVIYLVFLLMLCFIFLFLLLFLSFFFCIFILLFLCVCLYFCCGLCFWGGSGSVWVLEGLGWCGALQAPQQPNPSFCCLVCFFFWCCMFVVVVVGVATDFSSLSSLSFLIPCILLLNAKRLCSVQNQGFQTNPSLLSHLFFDFFHKLLLCFSFSHHRYLLNNHLGVVYCIPLKNQEVDFWNNVFSWLFLSKKGRS